MEWLQQIFDKILSLLPTIVLISPVERGARVTCGKWYKVIGPGWYIVWPIIQEVEYMEVITQVVDLPSQSIRTEDGHDVVISGAIRYHIVDIEKALFQVQDIDQALGTIALGVILEYFQQQTLNQCQNIEGIKKELRQKLALEASGWGLKIQQVYLTDLANVYSLRLFGDPLGREGD